MFTYESCGVSDHKAKELNKRLEKIINPVNANNFAGIFSLPLLQNHKIVSTCDGIGTKIIELIKTKNSKIMAQDLAAMNLNDLATCGASPLFMLDYIATGCLDVEFVGEFLKEFHYQLSLHNCALLGGETSQVKDLVSKGNFDVCAFAVGIVENEKILGKEKVKKGQKIVALSSNGFHSNGFSLLRKLYKENLISRREFESCFGSATQVYIKEVLQLQAENVICACANITGGGLFHNISRCVDNNLSFRLFHDKIEANLQRFQVMKKICNIVGEKESYSTFNMSIGMCLIVEPENVKRVIKTCKIYNPFVVGEIG